MRQEDIEGIKLVLERSRDTILKDVSDVGISSPANEELGLVRHFFPQAHGVDRTAWDFNLPTSAKWDLFIVSNAFMYSPNPSVWLKNIMDSCKYLLIQDLLSGRRSPDPRYLGDDGDSQRYTFTKAQSNWPHAYDMKPHEDKLLDIHEFPVDGNPDAKHFVALFKGHILTLCLFVKTHFATAAEVMAEVATIA